MKKRLIEVNRDGFLVIKVVKPVEQISVDWHPTEAAASDAAEASVEAEPQSELYVISCKAMMRFGPETDEAD